MHIGPLVAVDSLLGYTDFWCILCSVQVSTWHGRYLKSSEVCRVVMMAIRNLGVWSVDVLNDGLWKLSLIDRSMRRKEREACEDIPAGVI